MPLDDKSCLRFERKQQGPPGSNAMGNSQNVLQRFVARSGVRDSLHRGMLIRKTEFMFSPWQVLPARVGFAGQNLPDAESVVEVNAPKVWANAHAYPIRAVLGSVSAYR
jgi:hypothetical protein